MSIIGTTTITQSESPTIVTRVQYSDGTYLAQSQIDGTTAAIRRKIFYLSGPDPKRELITESFNKANSDPLVSPIVYDALQTAPFWDNKDDTGYNFLDVSIAGATYFVKPGRYAVEYYWTNGGGGITTYNFGATSLRAIVNVEAFGSV